MSHRFRKAANVAACHGTALNDVTGITRHLKCWVLYQKTVLFFPPATLSWNFAPFPKILSAHQKYASIL